MSDETTDLEVLESGVPDEESIDPTSEDIETLESGGENDDDTPTEELDEADGEKEAKTELDDPSLFKKLKAKHPDIFKEFPELRKEIALAQQITSVFPNVESAKEAQETIQNFDVIRNAGLAGDSRTILTEIAKADESAAIKFATGFMPMLEQNAPGLYNQVANPIIKNFLKAIRDVGYQRYKNSDGKDADLYYSIGHISKQLFGQPSIPDDAAPDPEVLSKKTELDKEKQQFQSQKQQYFDDGISLSAEKRLANAIQNGLDPENVLSQRMKDAIAADVSEEIKTVLKSDKRYLATMQSLFKNAVDSNYSPEASEKIINTFLARVKPLINPARQKVRNEYLQDKRNKQEINNTKKAFIPSSGSNGSSKSINPKTVDYNRTSDLDILSGKVNYKR